MLELSYLANSCWCFLKCCYDKILIIKCFFVLWNSGGISVGLMTDLACCQPAVLKKKKLFCTIASLLCPMYQSNHLQIQHLISKINHESVSLDYFCPLCASDKRLHERWALQYEEEWASGAERVKAHKRKTTQSKSSEML